MKLNIVILAAGMGKRMNSSKPKVLHTIAGKPMIQHVIDTARRLSPERIIIVVGHQADAIQEALAGQNDLFFASQSPQLGTGHAVLQAVPYLEESSDDIARLSDVTLILYGDVPLVQPDTLHALLNIRQDDLALLTENLSDPTGYGRIIRNGSGHIQRIVEQKDASPAEREINEVNTGMMAVNTRLLKKWLGQLTNDNAQGEYYLTDIIAMAVEEKHLIHSTQPQHGWETLGVNNRLQQAQLEHTWQREQARRVLNQGVALADPYHFNLRGELICGKDVFIDVGCLFEGKVELGDDVHIGPYCVIRSSKIASGTVIDAFSHIDEAEIGEHAKIGPYARLRPSTKIAHHAHVGNFTELKKTHLGPYSKANHLSYLGDAEIGEHVNIGAGTITCNYDGVNKFKTIIEDQAFIGSDTQLVAPVTVKAGSTIAAGTTVWKDTVADALTLNRKTQETNASWQRPKKQKK
ncbi:bifunctional UDP-N-acetylglucosamine diphosphorylase/glucosamine-1-phosphate N-acetyltransferase GlmU [Basilea psittacipulmonis]|uniref:Bifunctional protein GlmU n=1 Tax=Basilea psittacipulmonis DSM 24701 TaxID=1072685 RepID=A0A077DEZ2_9BURK|nr:bifunctional UDP-N-acetylglucosamine diphosphorylase/glucosamine-1-phosphate N-acetyltransferase GlmU [Basilea psittacipulmonis]AIL33339.1 bifunctional N-acetylglucosamine-1-phosphate uridyltransferase/glucosamine-1-phosphate acetyltransferase [Basilea psittacipulmonis DSM 24701]